MASSIPSSAPFRLLGLLGLLSWLGLLRLLLLSQLSLVDGPIVLRCAFQLCQRVTAQAAHVYLG